MDDREATPRALKTEDRNAIIVGLNDQLRRHANGGQLAITSGVLNLGNGGHIPEILDLVANFDRFTPDNDPYGEHDFGSFTYRGRTLFWKIDYYNRDMRFGSPDPADPDVTTRLLTILLAEEY
jgi:hypothetical protein